MVKWNARPLEEIQGIKFGMPRAIVREVLDRKYKEYRKNKFSKNTIDDFGICHVFYNCENKCEAVEMFGECEVFIDGEIVFPVDINVVKNIISDLVEDYGSYISKSQSIGIYAPNGIPESILLGEQGYYE